MGLPLSDDRQISRLSKRTEAAINGATVHFTVAVEIEIPHARARPEDANPHCSCTVPITDDWQIAFSAKRSEAFVLLATIPFSIAVAVEVPRPFSRQEETNVLRSCAVPVTYDRQLADGAKGRAFVDFTTIDCAFTVHIEIPLSALDGFPLLLVRCKSLRREDADDTSVPVTKFTGHWKVTGLAGGISAGVHGTIQDTISIGIEPP